MHPYFSKISNSIKNKHNPHSFLGLYDQNTIIQFSPNMKENTIIVNGQKKQMELIDSRGYFIFTSSEPLTILDYQIIHSDGTIGYDPYSCSPSVSLVDSHLFDQGNHYELYKFLGSHRCIHDDLEGTRFAVYAPNARAVYLRCDIGNWREKIYPMRKFSDLGIYELFIPGCHQDMMYKYHIITKDYQSVLRSDPFARKYELRPKTASIVHQSKKFVWSDDIWMKKRKDHHLSSPMNIYELHLGAWCKNTRFPNFKEIAEDVALYVKEMGYTHIELLPITEHPLDESWGYQVVGYFSPTSRYGTDEDFKYFVNYLHIHGIGVILDFVPAHFPKDESFLANFDGEALFEDPHPVMQKHPQWGTLIFNYKCKKVRNFLIAAALFWIEKMHIDILRIDAVESILYLNYQRKEGEYEKNHLGGIENLEGISFLQEFNNVIKQRHSDVMVIAEDPSLYDGVTKPIDLGGLGFSMKWNIGWNNDLFEYLLLNTKEKQKQHRNLLNSYKEVFREKYLLTISHDVVSKGKKSLLNKFSDLQEEKFAYLRLLYSVAIAHPGKKLFFMGHEVGEDNEFDEKSSWRKKPLVDHAMLKHKCFTKEMNHFYLNQKALFEIDFDKKGFAWIDHSDYTNNIISFVRKGAHDRLLIVHNFSKNMIKDYLVCIPGVISIDEVMNTDSEKYGGKGVENSTIKVHDQRRGVYLDLPELGTVICKVVLDDKKCVF